MRRRDPGLLRLLHFEYDECCLCGSTNGLHLHHVLLRSRGGDDVRENLVPLCHYCHALYHQGERHRLGEYLAEHRPDVRAYLVEKLGEDATEYWFYVHSGGYIVD